MSTKDAINSSSREKQQVHDFPLDPLEESPAKRRSSSFCSSILSSRNHSQPPSDGDRPEKRTKIASYERMVASEDCQNSKYEDCLVSTDPSGDSPSHVTTYILPETSIPAPLTREALKLHQAFNPQSGTSHMASEQPEDSFCSEEPTEVQDADRPEYQRELRQRGAILEFGDDFTHPINFKQAEDAIHAARNSPEPTDEDATSLLRDIQKLANETDTMSGIVSKILPVDEIRADESARLSYNQLWHRENKFDLEITPALEAPKPNITVGWSDMLFDYYNIPMFFNKYMLPLIKNQALAWPLFTVEKVSHDGSFKAATLKNLHNGTVMLSNLLQLKTLCGTAETFFNKVHVLSLTVTPQFAQLCCYWATSSNDGEVHYHGAPLESWLLMSPRQPDEYRRARRCIRNAIHWVKSQAYDWLRADLDRLDKQFQRPQRLAAAESYKRLVTAQLRELAENEERTSREKLDILGSEEVTNSIETPVENPLPCSADSCPPFDTPDEQGEEEA